MTAAGNSISVPAEASLPAAVGASVGAVKTAVGVCVTSLVLEEDEASAVEFWGEGGSLGSELEVWALSTSVVMSGAVGVTSRVGICSENSQQCFNTAFQKHFKSEIVLI